MSELHDDIMRIPVPKDIEYDLLANKVEAYKIGHRDARHAAAELAAAEGIEQLKAELECALGDLRTAMDIISRQKKAFEDVHDSIQREYWYEYAGLDGPREILDAAIDLSFESERT